jgi:hypothetical protein
LMTDSGLSNDVRGMIITNGPSADLNCIYHYLSLLR